MENERADARLNPSRETKFSGSNGDREKLFFPTQLTTRAGLATTIHTRSMVYTLLKVLTI